MLRSTCCILEVWRSLDKHVPVELCTLKTLKRTTSLKCNDSIRVWSWTQLSWLSSHCHLVGVHFQAVLLVGCLSLALYSVVVCLSGLLMFVFLSSTLCGPPQNEYLYVVLGFVSINTLSRVWPFFLFWHLTQSICIPAAPPQTLLSLWIPFLLQLWSWAPDLRRAELECSPGLARASMGENTELHASFSEQLKYWLVLHWAPIYRGGHRHHSWTVVIPHPCLFFTVEWIIFIQPGMLIYFLGKNHLWLFLGWSESPVLYISGWVTWGIPTNVVMMYVMYIRRECILFFFFFLIKMHMLARVYISDLFNITYFWGWKNCEQIERCRYCRIDGVFCLDSRHCSCWVSLPCPLCCRKAEKTSCSVQAMISWICAP